MAEIWDFYLEFMDWRTTSLQDLEDPAGKDDNMSPYLVFQMDSAMAIEKSVGTTVQKDTFLPYWDKIDRGILLSKIRKSAISLGFNCPVFSQLKERQAESERRIISHCALSSRSPIIEAVGNSM